MSNNPINPLARSADLGREVTPRPQPVEPDAKSAVPSSGPSRPIRPLPDSDSKRAHLLPGFDRVADQLGVSLEADRLIREGQVRGHLNLPESKPADPKHTLAQLADATRSGELTNDESARLFAALHPGLDPNEVGR